MSLGLLRGLFNPSAIALIGAGRQPGSVGAAVAANLLRGGFDGPVMPVHPTDQAVHGVFAYPSVEALPLTPDLAVIAVPAAELPDLLDALGRRGTRTAVILSPDVERGGPASPTALRKRLRAAADPHGLRFIGPGSLGLMLPREGIDASYAHAPAAAGDLAFVSQSGSLMTMMLDWAAVHGVSFSLVASLGDMADVDFADALDHLALDPETRAVLLCIDRVARPRKFLSAARAAARLKPVIVFLSGDSAAAAVRPIAPGALDEAALAGPNAELMADVLLPSHEAVLHAAFRRAGMLPVASLAHLVAAAGSVGVSVRVEGDRVAILCNGRGIGQVATRLIRAEGGRLAVLSEATLAVLDTVLPQSWGRANPVNLFADAPGHRYADALDPLLHDPGVDAVVVLVAPTALGEPRTAAAALAEKIERAHKPVVVVWMEQASLAEARRLLTADRVPVHEEPGAAIEALMQLFRYRRNQDMLMQTPASRPDLFERDAARAQAIARAALADGRDLLASNEAVELLAAYGIDVGVIDAAASHGQELRAGVAVDVSFGPIVYFGQGGAVGRAAGDLAVGLPPLNLNLARLLIAETRVHRVLASSPTAEADLNELALLLVKLAQLAAEVAEVTLLDLDPLLLVANGPKSPSVSVRLAAFDEPAEARLAIRPYPQELERTVLAKDGRTLLLRPIRPEDEPALQEFVLRQSPEDRRLRFFTHVKELDHRTAARLTQIDYLREMAIVLVDPQAVQTEILGVMRVSADAAGRRAEYAGAVRSDLKGFGFGRLLLEEIIDYCRARGIGEVWGEVLAENGAMLSLVNKLGFQIRRDSEDPSVMTVRLPLAAASPSAAAKR